MDQWKEVLDYSNYEVSNFGVIRNRKTKLILKQYFNRKGFLYVYLIDSNNGRRYKKLVHRAVAEVFLPETNIQPYVEHIDGNKENNVVWNLR